MFAHLNVHSEYTKSDGIIKIGTLIKRAKELHQGAVALTDTMNLFGSVQFCKISKEQGIYPIIGCDLICKGIKEKTFCITALVMNRDGYQNLCSLLTNAYTRSDNLYKQIPIEDLLDNHSGLFLIYNPLADPFSINISPQAIYLDIDSDDISRITSIVGDNMSIGFPPLNASCSTYIHSQLASLAKINSLPLVAVNNVRFIDRESYLTHEIKVCIQSSQRLNDYLINPLFRDEQFVLSENEATLIYKKYPEVLNNICRVIARCNFTIYENTNAQLPTAVSVKKDDMKQQLINLANNELEKYLNKYQELAIEDYQSRLQYELSIINNFGFEGYFLIVQEFIDWARKNNIMVGPGRGSGVGSLVAFCLKLTKIDPIKYNLLFERFLNPDRKSLPDFDIDFCQEDRDKVIQHLLDVYGTVQTSQIITFGTMAAKAVIRDVGRVLGLSYGYVDSIAKLIPNELEITLGDAKSKSVEFNTLITSSEETNKLFEYSTQLEGQIRNISKHAGGVVISPQPIVNYTALYRDEKSKLTVTHLDKNDLEYIGLIKFDLLAISMLTTIKKTIVSVRQRLGKNIEIDEIPLDDPRVYDELCSGKTLGVFQLEGKSITTKLKQLQPSKFEEIIAILALYRPGPLDAGMVDLYIDRKHGRQTVTYEHPALEPILKTTFGVIVYQEQVLQIAKVLANFTPGESELLRNAITKKKSELLVHLKNKFINQIALTVNKIEIAERIYQDIDKFTGYSFNKSHSTAYALVAYQGAWLKTYYPIDYLASYLDNESKKIESFVELMHQDEIQRLTFLPPSVNKSINGFAIIDSTTLQYSFKALKGMGDLAGEAIIEERNKHGEFTSFTNFIKRVPLKIVNKRSIEALIHSGAFDEFNNKRKALSDKLSEYIQYGATSQHQIAIKQNSLFDTSLQNEHLEEGLELQNCSEYSLHELAENEKNTFGYYFKTHPLQEYTIVKNNFSFITLTQIDSQNDEQGLSALVLILDMQSISFKDNKKNIQSTQKGKNETKHKVFLSIEDDTGRREYRASLNTLLNPMSDYINKIAVVTFTKSSYDFYNKQNYESSLTSKKNVKNVELFEHWVRRLKSITFMSEITNTSAVDRIQKIESFLLPVSEGAMAINLILDLGTDIVTVQYKKKIRLTPILLLELCNFTLTNGFSFEKWEQ
ncbi:MAG: DNA polymerase III subunit alpha [Methylacidiphilales bacterium]|nr:DNA polymerase III subunit alpha [Candidatus Methylacidiphilales bacterium]